MTRVSMAAAALCWGFLSSVPTAWATSSEVFRFENADIGTVATQVGAFTGTTFLFDPEQVKGKITLLAPGPVSSGEALALLKSALALHGYTLVRRTEATWIVPAERVAHGTVRVEVVRLAYAGADEVAYTLSLAAPPWVRIVPYYPTNSVIISGPPRAVEEVVSIIR
jgi:type II secretory pathway component GspD/PulD (secretin)